jgi:CRP/FNR family transcriptional regulator, cyclic AMP receptor protein
MKATKKRPFNVNKFLATVDGGRTITNYGKNQAIFSQGDAADSVFYIREGKVKVTVRSDQGKEAVQPLRLASAAAMADSTIIMRITKATIVRTLREQPKFTEKFMAHLVARNARVEEDLVRKAPRQSASPYGQFRQRRNSGGACHRKNKSGNAGGDSGHHEGAGEYLYE